MAWTQNDLDHLDTNYAKGVQQVTTSDGKTVSMRTLDEYMRLRKLMLAELQGPTRSPASFSVGRLSR